MHEISTSIQYLQTAFWEGDHNGMQSQNQRILRTMLNSRNDKPSGNRIEDLKKELNSIVLNCFSQ